MASASIPLEAPGLALRDLLRIWLRHLLSLLFPVSALVFLWTGPHAWYVAPLFVVPLAIFHHLDTRPLVERRQPLDELPAWPFDGIVYVLAILQGVVVFELVRMFERQSIFSFDMAMVLLLVGASSGFSIITAHELIHRKRKWEQTLGRLLLCMVLYEHFFTEHLRGHHVRVGTPDDPATARYGESYRAFWRRTVPAQFGSAWRLEARRLGDAGMSLFDRRMLRNRILHGIAAGWGLAITVGLVFGAASFVAFLLQALVAVRLLEAVNYFEHWGLQRSGRRVRPADSWDTHSWFTYYGLVGLSRHADHHAHPSRPYQQLRVWEEAPVLPVGYVGLVDMVIARNDEFRRLASEELRRRQLGPFAPGSEPVVEPVTVVRRRPGARLAGTWQRLPARLRPWLVALSTVALLSLGSALEAGPEVGYLASLTRNLAILGILVAIGIARDRLERFVQNPWLSWGAAVALLPILGRLSAPLIG